MRNLGVAAFLMLLAAGCGGAKVYLRPGAPAPNMASDRFIVLPVSISGLPGDNAEQQAALFGGLISAFKASAVPLQPIQPALEAAGFGALGNTMAHGMHHMVAVHESYDFKEDAGFHGGNSEYQVILDSTSKLVELVTSELSLDFKPKYVMVASVNSLGSSVPKTVKYQVIAGIYNLEDSKVDEVIWFEQSTTDEEAAILAEMGTLGNKLYGMLIERSGED